ncbi:hypothetical protein NEMIN01_0825 [Nematocida minor]|uniref:uncharacterized protein n=1 Tax=Nematocida minor TaxID=1912983 RepID=UPI002220793B|nr:uncharacterized protein NEMIN01_0825 [Nematocida minor]KAI5190040.1 hypothetical protein NEMIN01_0825 [Nematocida minor]
MMNINEEKTAEIVLDVPDASRNKKITKTAGRKSIREYVTLFFNRLGIKFTAKPIRLNVDIEEIKKDLKNLAKNENIDEHMIFGILHSLVSNHTKIVADKSLSDLHASLLSEIATNALEQAIVAYSYDENDCLYKECSNTGTNEKILEALREGLGDLMHKDLPKIIEKRINRWYKYVIELKKVDADSYLTYARDYFNERACILYMVYKPLIYNLRNFVESLRYDKESIFEECNLFRKNEEGVYNLDHAVNLLMKNKKYLQSYFTSFRSPKKDEMPESDKKLLFTLYQMWETVPDVYTKIHNFTDFDNAYVDSFYITGDIEKSNKKSTIADPTKCNYRNIATGKEVAERLEGSKFSDSIKAYIVDKIARYKELVKTGKMQDEIGKKLHAALVVCSASLLTLGIVSSSLYV